MSRLPFNGREGKSHPGALPLEKPIYRSVPSGVVDQRHAGTSRGTTTPRRTSEGEIPSLPPEPICPFCGLVKEKKTGRCPRCTMDDTPVTRQATQAKMGGWYVYQAHNPSTPGMNFVTLATLIRRGRVTRKSIVRGPTTGQFWRLAVRTKGVSREFGLCWNCGQAIDHKANLCQRCKHWQEPPVNPDVFLEGEPMQSPGHQAEAIQTSIDVVEIAEVETAAPETITPSAADTTAAEVLPAAENKIADAVEQPAAALIQPPAATSPTTALTLIDMGHSDEHAMILGRGLAAFNLPPDYAVGARPRHVLRGVLLAMLLAAAAFAAFLYFNPEIGQRYLNWGRHQLARWAATEKHDVPTPTAPADAAPVKNNPSQVKTIAKPQADNVSNTLDQKQEIAGDNNVIVDPKNSAPIANQVMQTAPSAPPVIVQVPVVQTPVVQAPIVQAPVTEPAAAAQPPVDPATRAEQAMSLWSQGIAAQEQGDFALAVQKFEAIKKLPESVWPMGLELRLEMARQKMGEKK